ncbi:MAG: chemotaxis protein CheW [Treponema sp.]|nr:chemotaxis protein CheW [Treponema sp.]
MRGFSFYVNDELFAVDVNRVEKIVRKMEITYIPAAPDVISGIINLKGRVVTIFNLNELLGRGIKRYNRKPQALDSRQNITDIVNIIIFKSDSGNEDQMGLIMDRPGVLINIEDELIRVPSLTTGAQESYCISGIAELDNTLFRIINIDSIIDKYKNNGTKSAENIPNGGNYDY